MVKNKGRKIKGERGKNTKINYVPVHKIINGVHLGYCTRSILISY